MNKYFMSYKYVWSLPFGICGMLSTLKLYNMFSIFNALQIIIRYENKKK